MLWSNILAKFLDEEFYRILRISAQLRISTLFRKCLEDLGEGNPHSQGEGTRLVNHSKRTKNYRTWSELVKCWTWTLLHSKKYLWILNCDRSFFSAALWLYDSCILELQNSIMTKASGGNEAVKVCITAFKFHVNCENRIIYIW